MRQVNTSTIASDESVAPETEAQTAVAFKRRLREVVGDVIATQALESACGDAIDELLIGNFYAARAAFERVREQVPKEIFRAIGAACITNHLLAYGCAAYRVVGETPPSRILVASGDASFNANDLDHAQEAYLLARSRRRLTRVADKLLATGHFYAARAIFERAGLRIPHNRFLRAAEQLRSLGDVKKASGAATALGVQALRD